MKKSPTSTVHSILSVDSKYFGFITKIQFFEFISNFDRKRKDPTNAQNSRREQILLRVSSHHLFLS